MKTKRILLDVSFIVITAVMLSFLSKYGLLEKYAHYAFIPILMAYSLGKYVERKFMISSDDHKIVN